MGQASLLYAAVRSAMRTPSAFARCMMETTLAVFPDPEQTTSASSGVAGGQFGLPT